MVIDLRGEKLGFIERALHRFVLVVAKLAPQSDADDGDQGNNGGEHQAQ